MPFLCLFSSIPVLLLLTLSSATSFGPSSKIRVQKLADPKYVLQPSPCPLSPSPVSPALSRLEVSMTSDVPTILLIQIKPSSVRLFYLPNPPNNSLYRSKEPRRLHYGYLQPTQVYLFSHSQRRLFSHSPTCPSSVPHFSSLCFTHHTGFGLCRNQKRFYTSLWFAHSSATQEPRSRHHYLSQLEHCPLHATHPWCLFPIQLHERSGTLSFSPPSTPYICP